MNHAKITKTIGVLLLIALVVPFVIYAAPWVIGADASYVVLTASMTPAISPGDVVIVAEQDPATIAEGDVITFYRGDENTPTTHRVIDVEETTNGPEFETQGDANDDPDSGTVSPEQLIGAVILTIPFIGYVTQFASSTLGFVLLVVVPFGLLLITEAWSIVRNKGVSSDSTSSERTKSVPPADDDRPAGVDPPHSPIGGSPTDVGGEAPLGAPTYEPSAEQVTVAPTPVESDQHQADDSVNELTITATDLTVSTLILGVFAGYNVYMALNVTTALTIGVAVGNTITFLIALGVRLSSIFYAMQSRSRSDLDHVTEAPHDRQRPAEQAAGEQSPQTTDGGVDFTAGATEEESESSEVVEQREDWDREEAPK